MERDFEKMGIYDLRNYARALGVRSPTTLKRNELIERINEIIEGHQPKSVATNKGRPPKHKATDEYMLDMLFPDKPFNPILNDINKPIDSSGSIASLYTVLREKSVESADNLPFEGYYDPVADEYGFAFKRGYMSPQTRENTVILKNYADEMKISKGDYINGTARYISSKNLMVATIINTINGVPGEKSIVEKFDEIYPTYPIQKILLEKSFGQYINMYIIDRVCPIAKGARASVHFETAREKQKFCQKTLESLGENKINSVLVSIGDRPEEIGELMRDCPFASFVEHRPYQEREQFLQSVFMMIKNACNRVECGEDMAIVFYNATNFVNFLSQQEILKNNLNEVQAKIVAENRYFDIFNLARQGKKGSLTIISLDPTEYTSIHANCKINIRQNRYQDTDITVDLVTSCTDHVDKILTANELDRLQNFKKILQEEDVEPSVQTLFDE